MILCFSWSPTGQPTTVATCLPFSSLLSSTPMRIVPPGRIGECHQILVLQPANGAFDFNISTLLLGKQSGDWDFRVRLLQHGPANMNLLRCPRHRTTSHQVTPLDANLTIKNPT